MHLILNYSVMFNFQNTTGFQLAYLLVNILIFSFFKCFLMCQIHFNLLSGHNV